MEFRCTIFLLISILYTFTVFVIKRYKDYDNNRLYYYYSKIAKLKEAVKEEAIIHYKGVVVLLPTAILIDLIILLLK